MSRILVWFVGGLLVGGAAVYGAGQFGTLVVFGSLPEAADRRGMSETEYAEWFNKSVQPKILVLTAIGALLCGGLCGARALEEYRRTPERRRVRPRLGRVDVGLTPAELDRVVEHCPWIDFERKQPAYVQGLLVGRLLESDPELAGRVDRLMPAQMAALHVLLIDRRSG